MGNISRVNVNQNILAALLQIFEKVIHNLFVIHGNITYLDTFGDILAR